ncbi:MAG: hypothetical protein JWO82_655 [Akkermansiaceae bacterium]|nr:hypothetical protein [Akkermansiaceae bacterium]
MKKYLVLAWLLLPLPVVVLHFGRGQEWLARDIAHDFIQQAEAAEKTGDWQLADERFRDADKKAGAQDRDLKLRLDLARVRTKFRMGQAVDAIDGVDKLLDDAAISTMPREFQQEARALSGRIHYYAGWVMRLEGAKRQLWMEEAELSRQNFRLLSEQESADAPADQARKQREDLESAVQLQRLSLTELMARPLPEEGRLMSGQGLTEQMAKRRGQRGDKPGKGDGDGPPDKGAGAKRFEPGEGS